MIEDFIASGFFALRTPLLSFEEILEWAEGTKCFEALEDPEEFARLFAEDVALLRKRLAAACGRPEVREAIFVASPSLDESLRVWEERPDSERGARVQNAIVKYYERMASRPTPFGLCAGGSVGILGDSDRLDLCSRTEYARHTRLDMDYLTALVDGMSRSEDLRGELRYFPNSSLFEFGGTIRYAEARLSGRLRSYFLVAADADAPLRETIRRARSGALRSELAASLVRGEITNADATAYVNQLIDAQILVPDLAPHLTGPESIDGLLDQLRDVPGASETRQRLEIVREDLRRLDREGLGRDPAEYRRLASRLEGLPADANLDRLFQVDMIKPAEGLTLDRELPRTILAAVEVLDNLAGVPPDPLESFRREFQDRYGDREVPLLQALDEDVGIGFVVNRAPGAEASPLLAGLDFPVPDGERRAPAAGSFDFIQWKLAEAVAEGSRELVLDPESTARFRPLKRLPLPDAIQIMGTVLPRSAGDPGAPRFLLVSVGGPSGARLLGRFCHGDAQLLERVRRHLADEERLDPEAIFCEIVHQPDGRIGNVLARPLLREWEIAFLGRSGAPPDRILSLADLTVRVSGDRVVLRAPALGREIVPRLTTAHNISHHTMKVYRFLGTLQAQGRTGGLSWSWGLLESQPRLPRVRVGPVVLEPETWNVQIRELKAAAEASGAGQVLEILRWRERRGLPRLVGLKDRDNVLLVDFENPLSVLAFFDAVRSGPGFSLIEVFPGPDALAVEGAEGRYQNEVIVPMTRAPVETGSAESAAERAVRIEASSSPGAAPQRLSVPAIFPPGSEWLYVKVYSSPTAGDRVLCRLLWPLVKDALRSGDIRGWFFIRYADPEPHLRVRLRGDPDTLLGRVLPSIREAIQSFLDDGLVFRLQVDTYDREIQRYGGPAGIQLCERLFEYDSEAVAEILGMLYGDEGADARWRLVVKGMDRMLDDLGFDLDGKYAVLASLCEGYSREFSVKGNFKQRIQDRYRTEKKALQALLDPECGADHSLWPGIELFRRRSERCRPAIDQLAQIAKDGALNRPLSEIASSLLHMHANRMFRSAARAQEAVVYRFLDQYYDSLLARRGKSRRKRALPRG